VGVAAVAAVGGAAAKGLRWIADYGTEPEASDEPSSAPGA
jgi:hypothetical protein